MSANYARADVSGVVIMFECSGVDEAKRYVDDFPLTEAGLIEWDFNALEPAPCLWNICSRPRWMSPNPSIAAPKLQSEGHA